jgi:alpha-1,2-rhamnosyltransferase
LKQAEEQGFPLKWLSDVSDAQLASLYKGAAAIICASDIEGYGLSVAEGLLLNGKVFANDLSVFREYAGDFPHYFDIESAGSLAEKLLTLDQFEKRTSPPKFPTWSEVALALAQLIQKASA